MTDKQPKNKILMPPERWINTVPFGEPVTPAKFIPMKTPYMNESSLWERHRFNFFMFQEKQRQLGREIVAVISLVFSWSNFYNPKLHFNGVPFYHIPCEGHKQPPTNEEYKRFEATVEEIYRNNQISSQDNKFIAVHCTHGFNRTGYCIVRYLCDQCKYSLPAALNRFAQCRPPGIYKQNYVDILCSIYHMNDTQIPVRKPEWEHPDPAVLEYRKFMVTEPIVNATATLEMIGDNIDGVTFVTLRRSINGICDETIKGKTIFPGSNPVSLHSKNIELLKDNRYAATYKSDGVRYFLYAYQGKCYLIDRKYKITQVKVHLVRRDGTPLMNTLLDGELVEDKRKDPDAEKHGKHNIHFLIFDVLCFEDLNLCNNTWDTRMDYSKKGVVQFRRLFFEKHPELIMDEDFDIEEKRQWPLNEIMDLRDYINSPYIDHETDGVILTPLDLEFVRGSCQQMLKMKPIELNSVDFIANWFNDICYLSVTNTAGKKLENIPISILEFQNEELKNSIKDGTIIECVLDLTEEEIENDPTGECYFKKGWKPLRIRVDKTTANVYSPTFVGVFNSIQDNITYKSIANMIPQKS